jgi:2,3-bisphosphoglycerate-dependent phosphoglycerate mutase
MPTLILTRHGQSQWNLENRFTGWVDVSLTEQGIAEAERGGLLIAEGGFEIDRAYTSVLTRAIHTCELNLRLAGQAFVPVVKDWRLNERHYGALTGLNKAETAALHGEAQVLEWRRSYDIPPPPLEAGSGYDFASDRRYRGAAVPATESLKITLERVLPYWSVEIEPHLARGETILVAAHGNSLRAIVKHLFGVSEQEIVGVEIPTANPLVIDLAADARTVTGARYLDASRAQPLPHTGR